MPDSGKGLGSSHLVGEVGGRPLPGVEDAEEVSDGRELREDERHREVLAKADRELDPRDVMSGVIVIKSSLCATVEMLAQVAGLRKTEV